MSGDLSSEQPRMISRRSLLTEVLPGVGAFTALATVGTSHREPQERKGVETTTSFLKSNEPLIRSTADRYGLDPEILRGLSEMEIGSDQAQSRLPLLNLRKISEQKLKSTMNYLRTLADPNGGTSFRYPPTGEIVHLGYSLGYLNQKPGCLSKTIIASIQDPQLRQELLQQYDTTRHHPDSKVFAELVHNNYKNDLEIAAAIIAQWKPSLSQYVAHHPEIDHTTEMKYYILAHNMSPYFLNGKLYSMLGPLAPDLKDKT